MLGQFLVELELPEPELELPELEDPELELPELELPVFPVLVLLLDDGVVVDEPVVPELVLGVEPDVVAAPATNAPPPTRPVVNAPTASTLRKRSCMGKVCLSSVVKRHPFGGTAQRAPPTCGLAQSDVGGWVELPCDRVTILRKETAGECRSFPGELASVAAQDQPVRGSLAMGLGSNPLQGAPAIRAHGNVHHILAGEPLQAVEIARHGVEVGVAGLAIHRDHRAVGRRQRHEIRFRHELRPSEERSLRGIEGTVSAKIHMDHVPLAPALIDGDLFVRSQLDATGPQRPHPVDRAVGAAPHQGEASTWAQHACHLGHGAFLVDPVPCRGDDDGMDAGVGGGKCFGPPGQNLHARRLGKECPHTIVRLDGRDVEDPLRQQARQDAGAGADFQDFCRSVGEQPIERFGRRPGTEPVVLRGDFTEGIAQDLRGLVLAHEPQSTHPPVRPASGIPIEIANRGAILSLQSTAGGRDKVVLLRGSGAAVAHHLAKVRVAGSNPVFRSKSAG
jgi:hypothetical protein